MLLSFIVAKFGWGGGVKKAPGISRVNRSIILLLQMQSLSFGGVVDHAAEDT